MTQPETAVTANPTIAKSINVLRWSAVALLVIGGVVNYLDRSTLSIANTTIAKEFGLDAVAMGMLLSAFSWPYAIANLPAGYLVDKFGPKRMFAWAAASWSVVGALMATANSFGVMYALRVLLGIAESPFFTAGLKVNQRWFNDKERAVPVAVVNTGSQIANAIAPPLLVALLLATGWRLMFVIIGALGIVVVLLWLRFYRDPNVQELVAIHGTADLDAKADKGEQVGWGELFKRSNTWFMIIGAFGIFYTVWVYLTWLPSYLQTALGFTLSQMGWIAMLPYACGIAGVLFGGWLSNRLVQRGVQTVMARKIPIVGGAVLAAASVLPAAFVTNVPTVIALLCIGYFAAQVPIGCLWTLAADVAPANQVASLGAIQNFGGFIGAAVAPIVTGAILAATNSYTMVFVVGGILLLVGAVAYGVFVKDRSSQA
ncbi:MFS transporter [Micropruina sonneratiae]|uniref:MFS transporter n=1 Tax=Micropruina sonneratiae TaxID=2986940 RepID=UPI002228076A|nr:MFS transporter [Micropruina sp. KQZ13P-5]MCW3158619.1 MFS transporter [Micropruina sp. KQZ13P-5]